MGADGSRCFCTKRRNTPRSIELLRACENDYAKAQEVGRIEMSQCATQSTHRSFTNTARGERVFILLLLLLLLPRLVTAEKSAVEADAIVTTVVETMIAEVEGKREIANDRLIGVERLASRDVSLSGVRRMLEGN